jgi:hypothetical protein
LVRPSLAAGNTPERLFDVETDRRIAEFKLARWDGSDGGRQQPIVKDLVRLAADTSGRKAELYLRRGAVIRGRRCRVKPACCCTHLPLC